MFRAPATVLTALRDASVDVVTLANNHGLDYGVTGLRDSLAAATSTGMPMVGIGVDEDEAYAPAVVTVRGQRIAVLGATQVLDGNLEDAWTARAGKPGVASAKRESRLLQEVARARVLADTVVVPLRRELRGLVSSGHQPDRLDGRESSTGWHPRGRCLSEVAATVAARRLRSP